MPGPGEKETAGTLPLDGSAKRPQHEVVELWGCAGGGFGLGLIVGWVGFFCFDLFSLQSSMGSTRGLI